MQDKKFVDEISDFIYSNYDEMKGALKEIKYLGRQEHSCRKYLKILLGKNECEF